MLAHELSRKPVPTLRDRALHRRSTLARPCGGRTITALPCPINGPRAAKYGEMEGRYVAALLQPGIRFPGLKVSGAPDGYAKKYRQ